MIPITSVKNMRASDARTIASGVSGRELMARAGRGVFEAHSWKGPVAIVCGSGNNAGDGYVLALLLKEAGVPCTLVLLEERWSEDGRYYYGACMEAGVPAVNYTPQIKLSAYREIVDCIFGTGFSGDVRGIAREAIEAINQSGAFVISVDINSGLCGDNGLGGTFVKSNLTVSIGTRKRGHFLGNAKDAIGALLNIDIGIDVGEECAILLEKKDASAVFGKRGQNSHKGNYGYVTVMGGCVEYAGAVKLANLSASALRAGCGVATLAVPSAIVGSVSPYLLESTLLPIPSDASGHMKFDVALLDRILQRNAAVAIGMGWGSGAEHGAILSYVLKNGRMSLVIDADGLNTLAKMGVTCLKETECRVVLTPHLKEFERLSGIPLESVMQDPVRYAKEFAREYGVCLLLKGCTTVVTDGVRVYLVDRGCAGMATAGSGDVLSGILAGLLGYAPANALTVACGAYVAGRAGELAERDVNPVSMLASDTVAHIAEAVGELLH